jgi:hypothetical protein
MENYSGSSSLTCFSNTLNSDNVHHPKHVNMVRDRAYSRRIVDSRGRLSFLTN